MNKNEEFIMKPKVDFCFKELMEDEEIRRGFISAVLGVEPEEIIRTELLATHLRKEHKDDKLGILDVRVMLNGESQIDMEIQLSPFEAWEERTLFYLSRMYAQFWSCRSWRNMIIRRQSYLIGQDSLMLRRRRNSRWLRRQIVS